MLVKHKKTKVRKKTPKKAVSKHIRNKLFESDGEYFLKLVVFVLLGTFWLKFSQPITWFGMPMRALPIGLILGLILVGRFERIQQDRKIWYAVLVIVGIISFFVPAGIVI